VSIAVRKDKVFGTLGIRLLRKRGFSYNHESRCYPTWNTQRLVEFDELPALVPNAVSLSLIKGLSLRLETLPLTLQLQCCQLLVKFRADSQTLHLPMNKFPKTALPSADITFINHGHKMVQIQTAATCCNRNVKEIQFLESYSLAHSATHCKVCIFTIRDLLKQATVERLVLTAFWSCSLALRK
jgi:hypothetical protein